MKIPKSPPVAARNTKALKRALEKLGEEPGSPWPEDTRDYIHWDRLRHLEPPEGLTRETWWFVLKLRRMGSRRRLPSCRDRAGQPFVYSLLDPIPEHLHRIDRNAAGRIEAPDEIVNPSTRDRYVFSSLIEEALRSSQIEGAVTTRKAAKEMIRQGRRPRTKSERMVLNNYQTMEYIREKQKGRLTPRLVFELHRMMTDGTLDDSEKAGRLRRNEDLVRVEDGEGNVIHVPPDAEELPDRLRAMCAFANGERQGEFLHPILRAIILHFWLAHDHPFVDGNGRCARALFYWSMLRDGYWLLEFCSISQAVHKTRQQYYRSFLYTETDENDLTYFLVYHLKVISDSIHELHRSLGKKARRMQQAEARLRSVESLNHRQRELVAHALRHATHSYTIEAHRKSHGVVYQTARADLLDLVEKGILTKRKRGRALVFHPKPGIERRIESPPRRS